MASGLVGRDAVLARLDEVWERRASQRPVVLLSGIGGVGKTALAVQWLSRRQHTFPDGLLYTSLTEPDGTPVPPADTLFGFLSALGVAHDEIPLDAGQRSAAFRSASAGRVLAILLDDAVSAAQVRMLLPATSSVMVLVTSRRRLAGLVMDGAELVDLEPLTARESHRMLAGAIGEHRLAADPAAADTIVAACGGLPLALGVVAARLRARPLRSLAREADSYVRHLSQDDRGPDDIRDVQAVFDVSYAELPGSAARLYRACGLHPGPEVAVAALADVLETPYEQVEDAVDALVEANLLADAEDDRVAQHDLLRRDARIRAERECAAVDRTAIQRGFARWYLARAQAADDLIHPHRPRFSASSSDHPAFASRDAAVAWWRRDLPSIRAVFAVADQQRWDDEVWQFCEASWGYFLHHRNYEAWLGPFAAGVAAAQRCALPLVEARLRSQLAFVYAKLRRFDDAVAQNLAALHLGETENHGPTRATALSQLGRAARGQGDLPAALGYYRQAAELQDQLGIPRGVALCRRRCGEVLAKLGRDEEAIAELTASAAMMAELGDVNQHARAVMTLAGLHARQGRYDTARDMLENALHVVHNLDSPYYTAEILAALGKLLHQNGSHEDARSYLTQARELYARLGDPCAAELTTVTEGE